jgi:membrane-associated phospholipid phosphatase
MDALQQLGIALIQALQTLSPALDGPMKFFTFLGTIEFYLILLPAIYWAIDSRLGIRLLLLLIGTDFLTSVSKQILHLPRPYWVGDVQSLSEEVSYGAPSAHASDSLAVWGYLAYRVRAAWMWILAVFLIVCIGLSRLYLGVHFPHDVLIGWLIGLVALIAFVRLEGPMSAWLRRLGLGKQIMVFFLISMAMVITGWLVLALISSTTDALAWSQFSGQARSASSYFTLSGSLFGAASGYVLMKRYAPFHTGGGAAKKAARYFLGIASVILLYLGLDALFAMLAIDESALGYLLRYIRFAVVNLWVAFGAPWVFIKLRLARMVSAPARS